MPEKQKQIDIFGNEIDVNEINKPSKTTATQETAKQMYRKIAGYDNEHICGKCKYFVNYKTKEKNAFKCLKIGVTNSDETTIRVNDIACKLYVKKRD